MPRYRFHMTDGAKSLGHKLVDFANDEPALRYATLLAAEIPNQWPQLETISPRERWHIEVTEDGGRRVGTVFP